MAETGTEFLTKLRREAQRESLFVLLETTCVSGLATLFLMLFITMWSNGRAGSALFWVPLGAAVFWLLLSLDVTRLASAAYYRHYTAVLLDRGLLFKLLEQFGTASFRVRTRAFVNAYHRQVTVTGAQAYPVAWRVIAATLLAGWLFFAAYFLWLLVSWVNGLSQQLVEQPQRLANAGYVLVQLYLAWNVVESPRRTALRKAVAEALLSQHS